MIAFLTSRIGIAGIGALALVLMYAGWSIQVSNIRAASATAISTEQQKTRDVQGLFDGYKLQVEQTITNQERIRADENLKALNEREAMAAEIDRLRGVALAAQRARDQRTTELLNALRNAPQTDVSPLAGAVLSYLDGVRRQQRATAPTGDPASP